MEEENNNSAKWLAGELTGDDLKNFEASPEFETYNKIAIYSKQLETPEFDSDTILSAIVQRPKQMPVVKMKSYLVYKVAAILIIALGIFFVNQNVMAITKVAQAGERTEFNLPDDSHVVLNSGSEIEYKKWNWSNNRSLSLHGEAFFKVAKGKTFDVNTSLGKVTVVGTQFNVRARNNHFEVQCFEGKVRVQNNNQVVFIIKGQIVVFENGNKINANPYNNSKPGWMMNEIVFNSEILGAIIPEIERQYKVKIEVNTINSGQKFTGTIPNDNIDIAMKIICKTFHLNYKKIGNSKIILDKE